MPWLRRALLILLTLTSCVGCDQASKSIARAHLPRHQIFSYLGDTVRLQYSENSGGFLGLGSGLSPATRRVIFKAGVAAMLLALAVFTFAARRATALQIFALALFCGGGLGNLLDRLAYGGVVIDFMNLGIGPLRTGIFNVADVAIMAGAIGVALLARGDSADGKSSADAAIAASVVSRPHLSYSGRGGDTVMSDKTLYERLGGYDAICAVAHDLVSRLQADPKLSRYWQHRGEDGVRREKQLLVDFLCSSAGGPLFYTGRDMKTSHKGMRISEADWSAFTGHLNATLDAFKVPQAEREQVIGFVQSTKADIVEA